MRGFDHSAAKWQHCCIHIKTAAILALNVQLIIALYTFSTSVSSLSTGTTAGMFVTQSSLVFMQAVVSGFLLLTVFLALGGLVYVRPNLIPPHIVAQAVNLMATMVFPTIDKKFGYLSRKGFNVNDLTYYLTTIALVLIVFVSFQVYLAGLLLKARTYLRAICEHTECMDAIRRAIASSDDTVEMIFEEESLGSLSRTMTI